MLIIFLLFVVLLLGNEWTVGLVLALNPKCLCLGWCGLDFFTSVEACFLETRIQI